MALPTFSDAVLRLPPGIAVLLASIILRTTEAHVLPRQTQTVEYHELNVVAWPPAPTSPPLSISELLARQEFNTVCGYVGGDKNLPATCSAGSHCVLDSDHGAIGCCPNGGACTAGVFTGCVDYNSGPQTEVNPYVYTCAGSDVCYKNSFDGGYYQYGCGTASSLANSVYESASGVSSTPELTSVSVSFTERPSSLATPMSINPSTGTRSFTRSTTTSKSSVSSSLSTSQSSASPTSTPSTSGRSSSSAPRSSSSTISASQSSTLSTAPTTTSSSLTGTGSLITESPSPADTSGSSSSNVDRTGAVVGGTVAGVAVLAALAGLIFYFCRRRRNNTRQGPGPAPVPQTTEYFSPMRSHGAAFAPLPTWHEEEETPYASQPGSAGHLQQQLHPHYGGTTTEIRGGDGVAAPLRYNPVHIAGGGAGAAPRRSEDADRVPLTRELTDFSQGFNKALSRIEENPDSRPQTADYSDGVSSAEGSQTGSPSRGGGSRPLWQQNRRQSRNITWM